MKSTLRNSLQSRVRRRTSWPYPSFGRVKEAATEKEETYVVEATLTKVKIQPLGDRVLVKPLEQKEVKKGGIIIPDTAKEKPQEGQVVAAGKGKVTEEGKVLPMEVKAGDRILYGKYSGTEIKIDDEEHLIMHQDDILGLLK
ncbi:MAG: co-chaperone GroES [Elusimicrobia bacterium]|nr:co-chaperone GroES [Elusimicrobiota bacterium]